MMYHSMIGVIYKGLSNHPRTLTFDSPLLLKLKETVSRMCARASVICFFLQKTIELSY